MKKSAREILYSLKPAEVFLLLDDDNSTLLDYLKFILADLLLKKVLIIEKSYRKPNSREPRKRLYVEVKTGPNYDFYDASTYEQIFLEEITAGKLRILYHYLRAIQKEGPSDGEYLREILEASPLKEFFRSKSISYLTGYLIRNKEGKSMKKLLNKELLSIENSLPTLFRNPEKLCPLIQNLSGNVFHLPSMNSTVWKTICLGFKKQHFSDEKIILNNSDLTFLSSAYYTEDVFSGIV